ncbi:DUF2512 family protein [Paenibacillus puerhi]|uniref:DUF2512 family protein n=1 Tax=Paenibacillus puerhi TaxID=2692622 RepID=UPI00135B37E2|nr:DUF2512 family protein [Paenibacillus puerhi]
MMKLLLKWIVNGAIVVFMLMYAAENITIWNALVTATALTLIAYFVGDQIILRMTNNLIATISDGLLAFIFLWAAASLMRWNVTTGEIFAIAIVLGIAEWFMHRYVFQPQVKARSY